MHNNYVCIVRVVLYILCIHCTGVWILARVVIKIVSSSTVQEVL